MEDLDHPSGPSLDSRLKRRIVDRTLVDRAVNSDSKRILVESFRKMICGLEGYSKKNECRATKDSRCSWVGELDEL